MLGTAMHHAQVHRIVRLGKSVQCAHDMHDADNMVTQNDIDETSTPK